MDNQEAGLSFNDIPKAMSRLLNEVGDIRQMLVEMRRNERPSTQDRHIPMSVDEAAEYLKIPKATLYDKLAKGEIPATKPGKRYVLYKDELDKWLDCNRRTAVPMTPEEENEAILASNRRKPKPKIVVMLWRVTVQLSVETHCSPTRVVSPMTGGKPC